MKYLFTLVVVLSVFTFTKLGKLTPIDINFPSISKPTPINVHFTPLEKLPPIVFTF